MQMKPDYSYGNYTITDIRLLRKNIGDMPARVLHVLRQLYPQSHYKNMTLQALLAGEADEILVSWRLSNETDIDFLKQQFSWANAGLEICEMDIALVNANEPILSYRLDESLPFPSFARLPSEELSRMQEYRFDIWSKENNLGEAYRYFLFPALGQAEIIRVWQTAKGCWGVHKTGNLGYCIKSPAEEKFFEIAPEKWESFQLFIQEFWQAESWQTELKYQYTDGFSIEVEGWSESNYKALYDSNPYNTQSTSREAERMFRALVPDS